MKNKDKKISLEQMYPNLPIKKGKTKVFIVQNYDDTKTNQK